MTAFEMSGPERYAHQRRGLAKMIATGGVTALLMDPGTGKTPVALDYFGLLALKSQRGEARVLVVCPLAAVDTWVTLAEIYLSPQIFYWAEALAGDLSVLERGEALSARGGNPWKRPASLRKGTGSKSKQRATGAPRALHHEKAFMLKYSASDLRGVPMTSSEGPDGLGTDKPKLILEVINIDALASREAKPGSKSVSMADYMLECIRRFDPDMVVVDESHKIKSSDSNSSMLLARIGKYVSRRAILTGTVMPHSPLDVYGQWRFLDPYAFGTKSNGVSHAMTLEGFKDRYAVMGGYFSQIQGWHNLDHMQKIMAQNAVVVRKADALDLPPTTDVIVPVELGQKERLAYQEMKEDLQTQLLTGELLTSKNRLAQMMRLRQITSGHIPDNSGLVHQIGNSKVQVIRSLVNDTLLGENRIVVFCLFTHEIQHLTRTLSAYDKKRTTVLKIDGSTSATERLEIRRRFGSDEKRRLVLVCQIKTMSLAVNELVTANHAIFGSLSWQRDDLIQARDRLDRIGQTRPVTFWYVLSPGTVDEVIMRSHRDRTNLENAMLHHIAGEELEKEKHDDGYGHTADTED